MHSQHIDIIYGEVSNIVFAIYNIRFYIILYQLIIFIDNCFIVLL